MQFPEQATPNIRSLILIIIHFLSVIYWGENQSLLLFWMSDSITIIRDTRFHHYSYHWCQSYGVGLVCTVLVKYFEYNIGQESVGNIKDRILFIAWGWMFGFYLQKKWCPFEFCTKKRYSPFLTCFIIPLYIACHVLGPWISD